MFPDLSIVVAVYNEDPRNLLTLLERLWRVISAENLTYEVIFVNDGSGAETSKALRQIASEVNYVKLIELSRNFGQQAAITAGLDHADGRAIVNLDSDLQDPPELIPQMVKYWRAGYQVVYAQRSTRRDRLGKRLSAYLFYRLLGAVSSVKIPWDTGDFRLMDRKVATELRNLPEKTRFLRGHIPWLGFRQIGIPIDRGAREVGETSYTLRKLFSLALDGLLAFSIAPLYVVPFIGVALVLAGLIMAAVAIIQPGGLHIDNLLIFAAIAGFTGIQLICTGFMSVYLSKIMEEVRGRPTYIVAERRGLGFSKSAKDAFQSATGMSSSLPR
jgi:glycosyltransferase involved in cell wall biosynthesis